MTRSLARPGLKARRSSGWTNITSQSNVEARRREIEAFRLRHNIVSLERDENQVLAQVRNLGSNLSVANEKVAAAEGKLRALTESAAAGNAVIRPRDDGTLANLEQRASQMREELRELERGFTADYLAKDPKVVTLRARLARPCRSQDVQPAWGAASRVETPIDPWRTDSTSPSPPPSTEPI